MVILLGVSGDITGPVPWLDDGERATWMNLMSMVISLPTAIEAQLKRDSGLSFFEYSILSALSQRRDHVLQMSSLAMLAGGSPSRLSHAVARLERQGLVRRRPSAVTEHRCIDAVLTAEGLERLEAAAPGHVREARRLVFDRLTPDQARRLEHVAHEVSEAASPEMAQAVQGLLVTARAGGESVPGDGGDRVANS